MDLDVEENDITGVMLDLKGYRYINMSHMPAFKASLLLSLSAKTHLSSSERWMENTSLSQLNAKDDKGGGGETRFKHNV